MNNKRIFVSGGAGIIGNALIHALLEMGADVFVGDLKPCPKEWLGKVRYRQGDLNTLTDQELLSFDPEFFFHLAAPFERSHATFSFWKENFYNNPLLSHHLMNCLKDSPSLRRVVFASSYLIYDPRSYHFQDASSHPMTLTEEAAVYPFNVCGAAKLFHEYELQFLSSFFKEPLSFTSVRIFPVHSRHSNNEISHWIRSAIHHETLVYHPLEKVDYISAESTAEGLIKLAQIPFNGSVNLGTGQSVSSQKIIDSLKKHFPDLKTKELPADTPFQAFQADMNLFQQLTGWLPPSRLEAAIPEIIQQEGHVDSAPQARLDAILVTSISKKIPLLQAVRKAADKLGHFNYLHGGDSDQGCIGQYEVDEFWHSPPLHQLTLEDVISYCHEHRIKAIIPTRNADLEFYAKHRAALHQQGIEAMVSDSETISLCLDKKHFADILIKNQFPAILTSLTIHELHAKAYVVKERYGAGSIHTALNISKEQALAYAENVNEPIFQPYIVGQEWSVDLYRTFQGKVMGCVARQRDLVVKGESQITTTASYPALEHLCESLAHVLRIQGHAVIQVIEDEEGNFHVIECNPRFGGASTASLAVGLDSFYWFLLECSGQSLQGYPFLRSKQEIRQVRYAADWILPWSLSSI